jgi:hypothetical protein
MFIKSCSILRFVRDRKKDPNFEPFSAKWFYIFSSLILHLCYVERLSLSSPAHPARDGAYKEKEIIPIRRRGTASHNV